MLQTHREVQNYFTGRGKISQLTHIINNIQFQLNEKIVSRISNLDAVSNVVLSIYLSIVSLFATLRLITFLLFFISVHFCRSSRRIAAAAAAAHYDDCYRHEQQSDNVIMSLGSTCRDVTSEQHPVTDFDVFPHYSQVSKRHGTCDRQTDAVWI